MKIHIESGPVTGIDENPYVGVDAGRNLHIHVNGIDFMNEELAKEMTRLTAAIRTAFESGYAAAFDDWGNEETHISEINAAMRNAWESRNLALYPAAAYG